MDTEVAGATTVSFLTPGIDSRFTIGVLTQFWLGLTKNKIKKKKKKIRVKGESHFSNWIG